MQQQKLDLYQGPLPSPDVLREYQEIIPDAPERFLNAFEKQVDHRQFLEKTYLTDQGKRADRGQHYALTIFLVALIAALILGLVGQSSVAVAFLGFDLIGGAGVFITGKVTQTRERLQRARIMTNQDQDE